VSSVVFDYPQEACQAIPDPAAVRTDMFLDTSYMALATNRCRLELSCGLGNEPALQGLLRVYKDYYPDIILGTTSTSRKSFAPVSFRPLYYHKCNRRSLSCLPRSSLSHC